MVHRSVMFSNVIVDIAFPRHLSVFSQSSCEVFASLIDVGGMAMGAIDLNITAKLTNQCIHTGVRTFD